MHVFGPFDHGGSDWPHIGFHTGTAVGHTATLPYAGELLGVLGAAVPARGPREKILSLNPARLYQFG